MTPSLFSDKLKQKHITQKESIAYQSFPNLHSFKHKLLSGNAFLIYK